MARSRSCPHALGKHTVTSDTVSRAPAHLTPRATSRLSTSDPFLKGGWQIQLENVLKPALAVILTCQRNYLTLLAELAGKPCTENGTSLERSEARNSLGLCQSPPRDSPAAICRTAGQPGGGCIVLSAFSPSKHSQRFYYCHLSAEKNL